MCVASFDCAKTSDHTTGWLLNYLLSSFTLCSKFHYQSFFTETDYYRQSSQPMLWRTWLSTSSRRAVGVRHHRPLCSRSAQITWHHWSTCIVSCYLVGAVEMSDIRVIVRLISFVKFVQGVSLHVFVMQLSSLTRFLQTWTRLKGLDRRNWPHRDVQISPIAAASSRTEAMITLPLKQSKSLNLVERQRTVSEFLFVSILIWRLLLKAMVELLMYSVCAQSCWEIMECGSCTRVLIVWFSIQLV